MPNLKVLFVLVATVLYKGDGVDKSLVLLSKPALRQQDLFWEYGRNNIAFRYPEGKDKSPNLAIRSGDWKLMMNNDETDIQLFNIKKDKYETINVANRGSVTVTKLKAKLLAWWDSLPKLTQ